jgi:Putative porin
MRPQVRQFQIMFVSLAISTAALAQTASPSHSSRTNRISVHAVREDVQQLQTTVASQQQQLRVQQDQIKQLQFQVQQLLMAAQHDARATEAMQSTADKAQNKAAQAQQSAAQAQNAADQASENAAEAKTALSLAANKTNDEDRKVAALENILGRFRLNGDVRVRGEDFFQDGVATRNRARIRVRLGLDGKLGEDFVGGVALATGTLGDPTTTNETLTNFFDRKTIALDRGYITYNPTAMNWLSLTGGKFAYPWYRTALTLDPDINPEGFDEKLSFDWQKASVKNFTVQAFQLLTNENSKGDDSFAVGGQVSTVLKFGSFTTIPSFTLIDWRFVDSLLSASAFATQATTTTGGVPIPGEGPGCAGGLNLPGVPPCAFAANGLTNATYLDASGKPHFLSGYTYADFILNSQLRTWSGRWPLNVILEYENNLQAAAHPLDSTGALIGSLGPQGKAYMGDISLGQAKKQGDFQFGYGYWRIEQDAILAAWAQSDQRAPTNILQNQIYVLWKLRNNTLAQYTLWLGRTLNSNLEHAVVAPEILPGQTEPVLKRQQFDLIYSF